METAPLVTFTSHNIRLDDGSYTKPDAEYSMENHPWFLAAKRVLDIVEPGDKTNLSLVDLGCLEGSYTVEFARLGLKAMGLDDREANIGAARYVQSKVSLPNLRFVQDDVWNVHKFGVFDVAFCCGLIYYVDRPVELLHLLSKVTRRALILQTHFAQAHDSPAIIRPRRLRRLIAKMLPLTHTASTTQSARALRATLRGGRHRPATGRYGERSGWKGAPIELPGRRLD